MVCVLVQHVGVNQDLEEMIVVWLFAQMIATMLVGVIMEHVFVLTNTQERHVKFINQMFIFLSYVLLVVLIVVWVNAHKHQQVIATIHLVSVMLTVHVNACQLVMDLPQTVLLRPNN